VAENVEALGLLKRKRLCALIYLAQCINEGVVGLDCLLDAKIVRLAEANALQSDSEATSPPAQRGLGGMHRIQLFKREINK
jgi:hypothetical protein